MTYITNQTKVHSLLINGVDYTTSFVSFQCADSSANRRGIVTTRGSITLTWSSKNTSVNDYRRRLFKRGQLVLLDITQPGSSPIRHPRGHLYVIATTFNPEQDTLIVEVGCSLALYELNDSNDISDLYTYSDIQLSEERQTFNNLSSALALTGHVLYQDSTGSLVKRKFFPSGVGVNGTAQGSWTSSLTDTALAVSPGNAGDPLPDALVLTYQVPGDTEEVDDPKVQIDTTTTRYYVRFPMKSYERIPPATGIPGIGNSGSYPAVSINTSSDCGNTPPPPDGNNGSSSDSCTEGFEIVDVTKYIYATKTNTQRSYYYGHANQLSLVEQETYGPALEVNSQYYTDKYAYCVSSYGTRCNLSGSCVPQGDARVLQGRSRTEYSYNSDGSVQRVVTENYQNIGYAAQPTDWRSTAVEDEENGLIKKLWSGDIFQAKLESDTLYLDSLAIEEYTYLSSGTVQVRTNYASVASEGIGINDTLALDARNGVKTVQISRSVTISLNKDAPDRQNPVTQPEAIDLEEETPIFLDTFVTPPNGSQPYLVEDSLPVELLGFYNKKQILDYAEQYKLYLVNWYKATALSLVISEALRPEIVTHWAPGEAFWYYDSVAGQVMLCGLDACSWSTEADGSVVSGTALWLGNAPKAQYDPGNNTVGGHVRPTHPGQPPVIEPENPGTPPSVSGDTTNENGPIVFVIPITIGVQTSLVFEGTRVPVKRETYIGVEHTIICNVAGQVVQSGSLVAIEGAGGIPVSANNILLTTGGVVLEAAIFG